MLAKYLKCEDDDASEGDESGADTPNVEHTKQVAELADHEWEQVWRALEERRQASTYAPSSE